MHSKDKKHASIYLLIMNYLRYDLAMSIINYLKINNNIMYLKKINKPEI